MTCLVDLDHQFDFGFLCEEGSTGLYMSDNVRTQTPSVGSEFVLFKHHLVAVRL